MAQILIWDYQNIENPKKNQLLKNIFFFNSSFSGASNDPPKYKIPPKNPVRHLEYASSPTYKKIGVFGMLEVRKLCYTTGIIILCNLIPQRPLYQRVTM